jgi:proteasome lid subunit RPN8/RPN11
MKQEIKKKYDEFPFKERGKLIITNDVKSKIDILHKEVGKVEWCGILTYKKEEGHISKPDTVVIRTIDIYPMEIGSEAYTEFETDDPVEVCTMLDRMPSYMDARVGFLHTHHSMNTFFSGTDVQELHDNVAKFSPYYLSLIVNFDGIYNAKVVYLNKLPSRSISIIDENDDEKFLVTAEREVMFSFDLDIEFEYNTQNNTVLLDRIKELKAKKVAKVAALPTYTSNNYQTFTRPTTKDTTSNRTTQIGLFDKKANDIRMQLGKVIMLNDKYTGTIWQAFLDVKKEIGNDDAKQDLIYERWDSDVYSYIVDTYTCDDFDEVQDVCADIIKILSSLEDNVSYGAYVKKFIATVSDYLIIIETN